jgi:hypothetical protein
MENYYTDSRVMQALEKSSGELMDILTFVKEIDFEIRDTLGFDVLWDSMVGRRCTHVCTSLLKWMGYEGQDRFNKQKFVQLLENNDIAYQEIGFEDPLIDQFPEIQEEIKKLVPMHLARKKWLIMNTTNFKEAIMSLTTKRSKEIRKYYLLLEELVQLYGAYTHKFKENQLKVQLQAKEEELEDAKEYTLILQDMMIKDDPITRTQVIYIATTELYAKTNNFKPGGVDEINKLKSRLSTYNTGRIKEDSFYYSDIFMVSNYHIVEAQLKNLLGRFRNKKEKEMYRLHYNDIRYIVEYLCNRDGEDVEEVNSKLTQFISNLNKRVLRPIVPHPNTSYLTSVTQLKEDGTVHNITIQSDSFEEAVKAYVLSLNPDVTSISKKKVFDDLKVRKDRIVKFPILRSILGRLRPEIKLIQKS